MADKAHTTGQSEISDKLQTGMMVAATAHSGLGQELVSFEQVMQFTAVEVVTWLKQTSIFKQSGEGAAAIEAAIIANNITGEFLLLCGHDTNWLMPCLPTLAVVGCLSSRIRNLYANAGIPLPARIDPPTVASVHRQDLSSQRAVIAVIQVVAPTVAMEQGQDISSTHDGIPGITRIETPTVSTAEVQDLSSENPGIQLPTSSQVDAPAVAAKQGGDISSPHAGTLVTTRIVSPPGAAVQVEGPSSAQAGAAMQVEDLSSASLGIGLPARVQIDPHMVVEVYKQASSSRSVDITENTQASPHMVIRLPRYARLGTHVFNLRYPIGMAFSLAGGQYHLSDRSFEQCPGKSRPALNKICHFSYICLFMLVLDAIVSGLS
ncbi:hypothetical protein L873DRAFT_588767 [Choiromyces venosus 120613-1]|uniref:Uncharacterized protein n=1 Tax=Choiromyces venosus 120613-1 TaxID=1336337 RepID=A0A3N4J7F8_9PEZI|nr:hypothetical protein L873DRAFT_588767 [Choiromyces venosus 120613-1]